MTSDSFLAGIVVGLSTAAIVFGALISFEQGLTVVLSRAAFLTAGRY